VSTPVAFPGPRGSRCPHRVILRFRSAMPTLCRPVAAGSTGASADLVTLSQALR